MASCSSFRRWSAQKNSGPGGSGDGLGPRGVATAADRDGGAGAGGGEAGVDAWICVGRDAECGVRRLAAPGWIEREAFRPLAPRDGPARRWELAALTGCTVGSVLGLLGRPLRRL